jgi:SM-20-related protein
LAAQYNDLQTGGENASDAPLFGLIAEDLVTQGYSIRPGGLPEDLAHRLYSHQQDLNQEKYADAGIGRGTDFLKAESVRSDEICWITGESDAGNRWIDWTSRLQRFLNQRLFLGLFSFESHFAHYAPGAYYKRHYDAFRGQANRILTVVIYLNPEWEDTDGGELVLYRDDQDRTGI